MLHGRETIEKSAQLFPVTQCNVFNTIHPPRFSFSHHKKQSSMRRRHCDAVRKQFTHCKMCAFPYFHSPIQGCMPCCAILSKLKKSIWSEAHLSSSARRKKIKKILNCLLLLRCSASSHLSQSLPFLAEQQQPLSHSPVCVSISPLTLACPCLFNDPLEQESRGAKEGIY